MTETEGRGADAVILAVGGNALIRTAMDAARPGGKVMLFAQTQHGEAIIDPGAVCMDEKTLLGSYSASFAILDEVTDLVFGGYRNGFDLTQLISHRFPLEQAVEAIEIASHPKADSMKIMIEPVPGRAGKRIRQRRNPGGHNGRDVVQVGLNTVERSSRRPQYVERWCSRAADGRIRRSAWAAIPSNAIPPAP